jgi:hypothetical protein
MRQDQMGFCRLAARLLQALNASDKIYPTGHSRFHSIRAAPGDVLMLIHLSQGLDFMYNLLALRVILEITPVSFWTMPPRQLAEMGNAAASAA